MDIHTAVDYLNAYWTGEEGKKKRIISSAVAVAVAAAATIAPPFFFSACISLPSRPQQKYMN